MAQETYIFKVLHSKDVVHPVATSHVYNKCLVEDFYGDNSMIDAHPSFNVQYRNAITINSEGIWNCRAIGVVLEDCDFQVKSDVQSHDLYLGVVGLTEPYSYLYDESMLFAKMSNGKL
jgi:hypothetical protein